MNRLFAALLLVTVNLSPIAYSQQPAEKLPFNPPTTISGYHDAAAELQAEKTFLAVPSADRGLGRIEIDQEFFDEAKFLRRELAWCAWYSRLGNALALFRFRHATN